MHPHAMLSVALKTTNGFAVDWRYGCQSRKEGWATALRSLP